MSDQLSDSTLPVKLEKPVSDRTQSMGNPDNRPKLGEWYWVKCNDWDQVTSWVNGKAVDGKGKKTKEVLMCVEHLASNHVQFTVYSPDGGSCSEQVRYRDLLAKTRREPNWQQFIQQQIAQKQIELQAAILQMADAVRAADLLPQDTVTPETLLPSTTRRSPEEAKKSLIQLRDETYPAAKKTVESITKEMVCLHKGLALPMLVEGRRMGAAVKGVEDRLFVLELYAGMCESAKLIKDGQPAPAETPVTVRQMMRYMDEECLIDYDQGGMNYTKLEEFDEWVAKPENFLRFCPEPRCVVAMKVRRHAKDYGRPLSMGHAFVIMKMQAADAATYLLIRNGEQVWRLATEVDFSPRLIPLRDAFTKPLEKQGRYNWQKGEYEIEEVDPDHLDYDDVMDERKRELFKHNRVLFLLQGLFDRSKVFSPHPMVNLADHNDATKWLNVVFDEETALPSANPPQWEEYRDLCNKTIRPGQIVYCASPEETSKRYSRWDKNPPKYGYDAARRPLFCKVHKISRDRKKVTLRWDLGEREVTRWELDKTRPVPGKPGWFYQSPVREQKRIGSGFGHQVVDMDEVFNVNAYHIGDYKMFLCDAALKGAYLEWAPILLSCEKYLLTAAGRWNPTAPRPTSDED